jgi:heme A synthase
MIETLHLLNGCLIVPACLVVAILLFLQNRRGRELNAASLAAVFLVMLQIFFQIYMGIFLLSHRGQRSMLHYSLGLSPLFILLIAFWLLPQLRSRKTLTIGIAFSISALLAGLAIFSG